MKPKTQRVGKTDLIVPPQNLNAERSVLASLLLENRAFDEICDVIKADQFYSDVHATMFEIIANMILANTNADALTLADALEKRGMLQEIGGAPYILEILETVPHAAHVKNYALIVHRKWEERSLLSVCQDSIAAIQDPTGDVDDILEEHERAVFDLGDKRQAVNKETSFSIIVQDTLLKLNDRMQHPERVPGLSTGFTDLDEMTNGFQPAELVVLAARPSMGKTALVCNVLEWIVSNGKSALMFSLEQSKEELAERFLCIRARLNGHNVRRGRLDPAERHALLDAAAELQKLPLWIDDTASRTAAQIRSISLRLKRRKGLDVIVVDYLQLIEPEGKKNANREQDVATITRRLKGVGKDLGVPLIALSQLNRGVDLRDDKRPKLSDLRESGAIEQDADIVMFLHRPDAYNPDDRPGEADVIVAKHRSGKTGTAVLQWMPGSMRFQDKKKQEPGYDQF